MPEVETLANIGVVLDFGQLAIVLVQVLNPITQYDAFKDTRIMYQIAWEESMFPQFKLEPISKREATKRTTEMFDEKYGIADLPVIVNENCSHPNSLQQANLPDLLQNNEELFDGTLGDCQTDPVKFHIQLGAKPCNGRTLPVTHSLMPVLKKDAEQLVDIGVQKRQPESEWRYLAFIIPILNQRVCFLPILRR